MGKNSAIQWCDHTANFWWGCLKVSPGCDNCYALSLSKRLGMSIWGPAKTTSRDYKLGVWKEVVKWNRQAGQEGVRRRVFAQSMSDLFEDHPQVIPWREKALALMVECTALDWLVLTKRPQNVAEMVPLSWREKGWPANVWIGTSVEDQKRADERIPYLLDIPAPVHFLSIEPLLEEIHMDHWLPTYEFQRTFHGWTSDQPIKIRAGVDWIIIGGESGKKARPFHAEWAEQLAEAAEMASVPVFVKQMGDNPFLAGKSVSGQFGPKGHDMSKWPAALQIREFPEVNDGN
jgi:protein gp37